MRRPWLLLILLVPALIVVAAKKRSNTSASFNQTEEITHIRNIAHQVLLSIGDKTSRVPPVEKLSEGNYRVRFGRSFSPIPDSLVKIFARNLNRNNIYSVELSEGGKTDIVYSFVLAKDTNRTVIPCLERELAAGQYEITVRSPGGNTNFSNYMAGFALMTIAAGGWVIVSKRRNNLQPVISQQEHSMVIGRFRFLESQQKLVIDDQSIELTGKECKLLAILGRSPNEVVERERLQKEVWEDEGVIVTRSLDMFISKLRKKLVADPEVSIVNVHGKGYKLITGMLVS